MSRRPIVRIAGLLTLITGVVAAAAPFRRRDPIPARMLQALVWRNIGPFRGGRVAAVTGVIGQPGVFYIGLPLGGVWKTTSAGTTWYPIFDSVKEASSVGSVQVAPSDPNILYVGMGDLITGGGINEGNGVYKSTDAGKTWTHLGLDSTKQIPSILIDPRNPDLVLLAAQGNIHSFTDQRGVFRSTDGGKSWTKTLYVDSTTGAQEIAWAYDNPRVMLAVTVRHYSNPLAARGGPPVVAATGADTTPFAGRGGGRGGRGANGAAANTGTLLFKSTDEGVTWTEITGHGLPENMTGRTSIAVANNTNSQRMFLIGNFGLYRSDDGGANWRRMDASDRRIANGQNGYNCGVYVDPQNPDIVYTINTSSFRSLDGGNTFTGFKGAPGGDDPQQMWIDPTNGQRMLLGVDQGATVSLDGGKTWSSWYNQATGQVYHISADNSYPYWVYATQQDAGSVAARSRGDLGEITPFDWYPTAGYEFGSIVADPLNPKIVYAGGPASGIVKITYPSGQWINVSPNVETAAALRKVGNQPLAWNASNPHELLAGFQYLMATTDGGVHWKKLSPDLGYPKGVVPPAAGPSAPARGSGAPGPAGGAIESFSTSSVAPGVMWVGTNNGLVKVTKNHGLTWDDVTIPDLPNPTRADISAIDASHQDAATAYVAIDYHGVGVYTPWLYRTHDYGKTWTKIVNGMSTSESNGAFTRVIRADTRRAGLLFAGTESAMYVSFDDGDNWQSLMLNLPNTSYRDITIKDNDLVVGTYGRSIWILDDISPLRQMTAATINEPVHLFAPGKAYRQRRNVNGDTPFPPEIPHAENPPLGAVIYYSLGAQPSGDITLDVTDAAGHPVRHFSSAPIPPLNEPPPVLPDFWLDHPKPMPTDVGLNRIHWDLRYDAPPAFSHNYEINANPGETPASPEGPLVIPGVYTVTLTVDGKAYTQHVTVVNDPRSPATAADLAAQHQLQMKMYDGAREAYTGYTDANTLRAAAKAAVGENASGELEAAHATFDSVIAHIGGAGAGEGRRPGVRPNAAAFPGVTPEPNFGALVTTMDRQLSGIDNGDMAPNEPTLAAFKPSCEDLHTAVLHWNTAITKTALPAFNAALTKAGATAIAAPRALAVPECAVAVAAAKPGAAKKGK